MKMILEGIRIIDWTVMQAGPYAAALLADLGAEVIHLEPRLSGDSLRSIVSSFGVSTILPGGRQVNFEEHNRNKKSLAVDLNKPEGKEIVYRLAEKSDIFLTNYRPKVRTKLGLDYETLSRRNPQLIYASCNGFGLRGPDADNPSMDPLAQARSGAAMSAGQPDGPPIYSIPNAGDRATSAFLAYGMLAALIGRDRLGVVQEISVSQLGAMIVLQGFYLMPNLLTGQKMPKHSQAKPPNALVNYYKCQDGKWVSLCIMDRGPEWSNFCSAIGMPELSKDSRFENAANRSQNTEELVPILNKIFASKARDEWEEVFRKSDIWATRVNELSDLTSDPQVLANDYIINWEHPTLGAIKFVGFPVEFGRTPTTLRSPAPELGQHSEEIINEVCGYTWDQITDLKQREVI